MSKKQPQACPIRKTSIGGQALMEGIMMRGPKTTAMEAKRAAVLIADALATLLPKL